LFRAREILGAKVEGLKKRSTTTKERRKKYSIPMSSAQKLREDRGQGKKREKTAMPDLHGKSYGMPRSVA